MPALKNTSIIVVLLVLLAFTKLLLDHYSKLTSPFHDLLIFNYQLLLFLWLLIFLPIYLIFKIRGSPLILTIIMVTFFVILEFTCYWLMMHPANIPSFCKQTFKDYYITYQRNIIQYEPFSEYDSTFFYRLRPNNSFSFNNIEFSNHFSVNSSSNRDDDSSNHHPQIICLGDSYTLGWGVEQGQSFPEFLQQKSHKNVLNASMSSFGTARELMKLKTTDTSALQYIILQYCKNDVDENLLYNERGFLPISSRQEYINATATYVWQRKYFPENILSHSFILISKDHSVCSSRAVQLLIIYPTIPKQVRVNL